ncbi:MAG: hypothetical protein KBH06_06480 [Spirochaetes bacterium]|nr:hypothetical protein [Spirochaetota bacterium]
MMKTFSAAFFSLLLALSCSHKSKYETMEQYFSKNNNHEVNLLRIGTTSYYHVINILSANSGIITAPESELSKVSIKSEIKKSSTLSEALDDFINFRSDILIISYSDYMKNFDSLKYFNPRVFAVSARSSGNLVIEGNIESFKKKSTVSITDNTNSFFSEFYCRLNNVKSGKNTGEIISTIDLLDSTPSKDTITSTASFPYFEPYVMIARKYFLSERTAVITKFLKTIYEIQTPKAEILSSAGLSINPEKNLLIEQASFGDTKAFFGESSSSPNFIRLFKIRGGDNKRGIEFIDSFEPFFISSIEIKTKSVLRNQNSAKESFEFTIKAEDGNITSSEIIKIEFYAFAGTTMRNPSVKLSTSGFTDYTEESAAIRRVKEKIATYGYSPGKISETRNRNGNNEKYLTITFISE